jgi:hypothetical protein
MREIHVIRELSIQPLVTLVPNQLSGELLVTSKEQDHDLGLVRLDDSRTHILHDLVNSLSVCSHYSVTKAVKFKLVRKSLSGKEEPRDFRGQEQLGLIGEMFTSKQDSS